MLALDSPFSCPAQVRQLFAVILMLGDRMLWDSPGGWSHVSSHLHHTQLPAVPAGSTQVQAAKCRFAFWPCRGAGAVLLVA